MPRRDRVRRPAERCDLLVLGVFAALGVGYLLLPAGRAEVVGYATVTALCSLVVVVVVAVSPARHPWLVMAAAQLLFAAAEAGVARRRWLGLDSFPSVGDALFLVGDVVLFAAVLRLLPARRGGARRGPVLGTLLVILGVGTLLLVHTVLPTDGGGATVPALLVAAARPLADIVIVLLLVRATGWPGRRPRAFWLLAAGLAATVVADLAFTVLAGVGAEEATPRWIGVLWLAFSACVAAAVCGPSAVELGHPPLERGSDTDPLTGLPNRRAWDDEVARVFARAVAEGQGTPITVAIVDLDHFTAFNDTFGHDGGDDLLVSLARRWSQALPGVFLARWGGEEFTLLLPGVGATSVIERLHAVHGSVPRGQTCSIGAATWNGAEVPPAVLARADAALHRAKRSGRNRTVVAGDRDTAPVEVLPEVG